MSVQACEVSNISHKGIDFCSGLDIRNKGEADVIDNS